MKEYIFPVPDSSEPFRLKNETDGKTSRENASAYMQFLPHAEFRTDLRQKVGLGFQVNPEF